MKCVGWYCIIQAILKAFACKRGNSFVNVWMLKMHLKVFSSVLNKVAVVVHVYVKQKGMTRTT